MKDGKTAERTDEQLERVFLYQSVCSGDVLGEGINEIKYFRSYSRLVG